MKFILNARENISNIFFIDDNEKTTDAMREHLPEENVIFVEDPVTIFSETLPQMTALTQKLHEKKLDGDFDAPKLFPELIAPIFENFSEYVEPVEEIPDKIDENVAEPEDKHPISAFCLLIGILFPASVLVYMLGAEVYDALRYTLFGKTAKTSRDVEDDRMRRQTELNRHLQMQFEKLDMSDLTCSKNLSSIMKIHV